MATFDVAPGSRADQLARIPESISRVDYLRLIESVGFDVHDLVSLEFHRDVITAVVAARDEQGYHYASGATGDEFAVHRVSIPVRQDD